MRTHAAVAVLFAAFHDAAPRFVDAASATGASTSLAAGGGGYCIGAITATDAATLDGRQLAFASDVYAIALATGPHGDVYFSDRSFAGLIRVVHPDGTLSSIAGNGTLGFGGDGGLALLAQLGGAVAPPAGLAVSPAGDVILSDPANARVRVVSAADAKIATLAGNGSVGYAGDGGPATAAALAWPAGVALGPWAAGGGDVYFADAVAHVVRVVVSGGIIHTVAGTGTVGTAGDGGPATAATLDTPYALVRRAAVGDLFVTTRGGIRRVMRDGTIRALGAAPLPPLPPDDHYALVGLAVDDADADNGPAGALLVADRPREAVYRVRPDDAAPRFERIAGTAMPGYTGDGGPGTAAALLAPSALALYNRTLYIALASGPSTIRALDLATQRIRRVAGNVLPEYGEALPAQRVSLANTYIVAARDGIYAGAEPGVIVQLAFADWLVRRVAGTSLNVDAGDGGPASAASFSSSETVIGADALPAYSTGTFFYPAVSPTSGALCIGEAYTNRVRCIDAASGTVATVLGNGSSGYARLPTPAEGGADPTAVAIDGLNGLEIDGAGNLYFGYAYGIGVLNATTRRAYHYACGTLGYGGDGGPATAAACARSPFISTIDDAGVVLLSDTRNHCVRAVAPGDNGVIYTVAGVCGVNGSDGDGGPATAAHMTFPYVSRATRNPTRQSVYLVDSRPSQSAAATVRRVTIWDGRIVSGAVANATIETVAGGGLTTVEAAGVATGGAPATSVSLYINDLIVDASGNVIINLGKQGFLVAVVMGEWINCPPGYACPCATPVACVDPAAGFCPGNTLAPLPIVDGFYALLGVRPAGDDAAPLVAFGQAPCPPGSYCAGGIRTPCLPGTYGSTPARVAATDCAACPAGSFSAVGGATNVSACSPCPPGTYAVGGAAACAACPRGTASATVGASTADVCVPCGAGMYAPPGASACAAVAAGAPAPAPVGDVLAAEAPPAGPTADGTATDLLLGFPLALAAVGAVTACALSAAATCPGSGGAQPLRTRADRCLRSVDLFALNHAVAEGSAPVRRRTLLGGAMSVLAAAAIAAAAVALLIQFTLFNALAQRSVLPTSLAAIEAALGAEIARATAGGGGSGGAAALPFLAATGVALQVRSAGPGCAANVTWAAAALLPLPPPSTAAAADAHAGGRGVVRSSSAAGDSLFVREVVKDDAASTLDAVLAFRCDACVFTPLSALTVTLPPACQFVSVAAAAVSADGARTYAAYAAPPLARRASTADPQLARLDVTVVPSLELYVPLRGATRRGYRVSIAGAEPSYAPDPAAVVVAFALSPPTYYVSVTEARIQSPAALFAALVGLLGIVGAAGFAFELVEGCRDGRLGWTARALAARVLARQAAVRAWGGPGGSRPRAWGAGGSVSKRRAPLVAAAGASTDVVSGAPVANEDAAGVARVTPAGEASTTVNPLAVATATTAAPAAAAAALTAVRAASAGAAPTPMPVPTHRPPASPLVQQQSVLPTQDAPGRLGLALPALQMNGALRARETADESGGARCSCGASGSATAEGVHADLAATRDALAGALAMLAATQSEMRALTASVAALRESCAQRREQAR